jgi:hypothetical protein
VSAVICRAFVQEKGNGRLDPEMRQVADELRRRGVPVDLFTEKRLVRRQLALSPETLVVGYVPIVLGALQQLGVRAPEPDDYPMCLRALLHRRVWESTVGAVEGAEIEGQSAAVFVKPKGRLKQFTGFVVESRADLWRFGNVSRRQPVYCSEVVRWVSEHRVFVIGGVSSACARTKAIPR